MFFFFSLDLLACSVCFSTSVASFAFRHVRVTNFLVFLFILKKKKPETSTATWRILVISPSLKVGPSALMLTVVNSSYATFLFSFVHTIGFIFGIALHCRLSSSSINLLVDT